MQQHVGIMLISKRCFPSAGTCGGLSARRMGVADMLDKHPSARAHQGRKVRQMRRKGRIKPEAGHSCGDTRQQAHRQCGVSHKPKTLNSIHPRGQAQALSPQPFPTRDLHRKPLARCRRAPTTCSRNRRADSLGFRVWGGLVLLQEVCSILKGGGLSLRFRSLGTSRVASSVFGVHGV